jgi:pectate lyase
MKLSVFALNISLLGASARPNAPDFSLVGFAKDNPLGPTTGGAGGATVTVTTPSALKSAIADTTPRTIYLSGNFTLPSRLSIGPNKSLIGTGAGANILSNGFNIKSVSNVIVRNLGIRSITGNDGITIQNSTRVWIDHNEFSSGGFPASGPDVYDGQCDIIRASDWITVSWNYFHDHWKSSLVGNSDTLRDVDQGHLHVTYQ